MQSSLLSPRTTPTLSSHPPRRSRWWNVWLVAILALFAVASAQAATLTVTNANDSGPGSLRATLASALSGDIIQFSAAIHGQTITLTSGHLPVSINVILEGPGPGLISISGNNANRVFVIAGGASLTASRITLRNGAGNGGAILNSGTLNLSQCIIRECSGAGAGAIYSNSGASVLSLTDCTFTENATTAFGTPAAVYAVGTASIRNCTFSGNSGTSGIVVSQAVFTMVNCTITGNTAPQAFRNITTAQVNLRNTIISGNNVGVEVQNVGTNLNMENCLVGGGLPTINGTNLNNIVGPPSVGPLQYNGGPTPTHALLPGSLAIDAGNNALAVDGSNQPLPSDQRGLGFPRVSYGTVDIGAYEWQDTTTLAPTLVAPADNSTTISPVNVSFSLPEAALAGSVKLNFGATQLTLAASQETAGAHSFSFNPANPLASAEIASGNPVPDGTYSVTLSYQDSAGNLAASDNSVAVTIDTATLTPTLSLPEAGSSNIDSVDVAFGLPEAAQPGSVTLSFGPHVLTLSSSEENAGEHVFSFSPADPAGSSSSVASGPAIPNGTYTVTLSYRDIAGNPVASAVVNNVTVGTASPLVADAVTVATGGARIYPLANDSLGSAAVITSVTNPQVTISPDGRSLLVPAGFTGSFDYSTLDGSSFGTGTVNTQTGTPATASRVFSGLLYDQSGAIAGWARLNISSGGSATAQVRRGVDSARASFAFGPTVTTANPTSTLGALVVTRESDGTITLGLGAASGKLRPRPATVPAGRHHVALASVDAAIPGGGFLVVNVNAKGMVKIAGLLPDGRPLTVGVEVADNGSINFYGMESKGVSPAGILGGELVPANLPLTDVTGELAWSKPSQAPGSKGTHLGGVDTVLVANGCLYNGVLIPDGAGTLSLSGGNLLADENNSVTISLGKPSVPTGSLRAWASVKASTGRFTPKVLLPGGTRPVVGSGVYLPKSRSAWGYFPGTTVGGRVELIGPALIRN